MLIQDEKIEIAIVKMEMNEIKNWWATPCKYISKMFTCPECFFVNGPSTQVRWPTGNTILAEEEKYGALVESNKMHVKWK